MRKISALILLSVLTIVGVSQEKVNTKFGNGLLNVIAEDSSWSMKLAFRFQTLYVGDWEVNDSSGIGSGSSQFLIRRSRLKFGGFIHSPKIQYKAELGLSNKDLGKVDARTNEAPRMILDAVIKWNFYKNLTLWGGQTKLPGNRERVVSSANLQFVDRSYLNKRFNIDRDMGFQLRNHHTMGKNFIIREMISFAQGEGRNLVQDNLGGYQWTGRIEFLPFGKFKSKGDYTGGDTKREDKPKLSIAASYDYNDRAVKDRSNQGSYMQYVDKWGNEGYFMANVNTLFVDAMFKYKGFSIMAEYADRQSNNEYQEVLGADSVIYSGTVYTGNGLNFQLGYIMENNWEFAGRYTQINPNLNTGKDSHTQYTFGISKYVVGHKLKVQTDVSYLTSENSDNSGLMYRLQFELHF
jgi:phosphate-selective porin OprO/OprP